MDRRLQALLLASLAALAPLAAAGSLSSPEVTDPRGDAVHLETGEEEPSLDVTDVWMTWSDGYVVAHVKLVDLTEPGPAGTNDPVDDRTYVDVYWDDDGTADEDQDPRVARWRVDADGTQRFLAGQARVIERKAVYEPETEHDTLHGAVEPVLGTVELGEPGFVHVRVPASVVGDPGPGDVLEEIRFSTYVDHHQGLPDADLHHHPGHVDINDEPGDDFRVPAGDDGAGGDGGAGAGGGAGSGSGDDGAAGPGGSGGDDGGALGVPAPGAAAAAAAGLAAGLLRRRR